MSSDEVSQPSEAPPPRTTGSSEPPDDRFDRARDAALISRLTTTIGCLQRSHSQLNEHYCALEQNCEQLELQYDQSLQTNQELQQDKSTLKAESDVARQAHDRTLREKDDRIEVLSASVTRLEGKMTRARNRAAVATFFAIVLAIATAVLVWRLFTQ
jgi:predicted RNase H-like nuclease (RuvC/YqgF family)